MKLVVSDSPQSLGRKASRHIADSLREAIAQRGEARLVLSTGKSQFETLDALVSEDVAWSKVTMFHLDEYIGLPQSHPASFRKYLRERFTSKVKLRDVHFVEAEGRPEDVLAHLNAAIASAPVDVGVIGLGENAHIAFNDPPADFESSQGYRVVTLDDACRRQQVGEGWFAGVADVPEQAISMTVRQIMRCRTIVSPVPHGVKAKAIKAILESPQTTNLIPATILREHPDWTLYLDAGSASLINPADYR